MKHVSLIFSSDLYLRSPKKLLSPVRKWKIQGPFIKKKKKSQY